MKIVSFRGCSDGYILNMNFVWDVSIYIFFKLEIKKETNVTILITIAQIEFDF